jgi:hypothetical protein
MEDKLSCNVSIHEEELEGKKVFVVECPESRTHRSASQQAAGYAINGIHGWLVD